MLSLVEKNVENKTHADILKAITNKGEVKGLGLVTKRVCHKKPYDKDPNFCVYESDIQYVQVNLTYDVTGCKQVPPKGHPSNVFKNVSQTY